MPVELPPPPYELNALEPHMSQKTLETHWGKHHRAYVTNLNKQIEGSDLDSKDIVSIVNATWNNGSPTPAFNNAAQTWNHTFFFDGMKAGGGGEPGAKLMDAIKASFGSFEEFTKQFKAAGATQFGSGWAWLVTDKGGMLTVTKSPNAETPIVTDEVPILCMDVWEHAYYIDYLNARPSYMDVFVDKLINWDKVEERYSAALA